MHTSSTNLPLIVRTQRARRHSGLVAFVLAGAASAPAAAQQADTLATSRWTLDAPSGAFSVALAASGRGCPPGSLRPVVSPDGATLTTTFSQLHADLSPSRTSVVTECAFEARLRAPAGRSYAVRRFGYVGRADLDPGVVANHTASYVLENAPPGAMPGRTQLVGPFNGPYTSIREIAPDQLVWSPCSTDQPLSFVTQLSLQNGQVPGWGMVSLNGVDTTDGRLVLELASRGCSVTPVEALAPTQVTLLPATINPGQPFTVKWMPLLDRLDAAYAVEVAQAGVSPAQVHWQSALTPLSALVYTGPVLSAAPGGSVYEVVVSTYLDGRIHRSRPALLRVLPAPGSAATPALDPPITGPSASQPSATSPNSQTPSADLPVWARPLLGSYALATEGFATTVLGSTVTSREIALAEFLQVGDQIELRTRLCSKESSSLTSTVTLRTPDAYPALRQRVLLENGRWRTLGAPLSSGFERVGYVGCNGRERQRVPKRPEQTWIVGATCRCPASQSEPPTADDCRVTDPDRDGNPGLAYPWSGLGLAESQGWVSHTAATNRAYFVDGRVDPGGAHTAAIRTDEATFQLACEPGECGVSVETRPCTQEHNRARFVRLGVAPGGAAQWTCALLRQRAASVIPAVASRPPVRCAHDVVNPAP